MKCYGGFILALNVWKVPQKEHELNLTFIVFLHFNSQIKESTIRFLLNRSGVVQRQNLKTAARLRLDVTRFNLAVDCINAHEHSLREWLFQFL